MRVVACLALCTLLTGSLQAKDRDGYRWQNSTPIQQTFVPIQWGNPPEKQAPTPKLPWLYMFFQENCPPCVDYKIDLKGTPWETLKSRYTIFVMDISKYDTLAKKYGVDATPFFVDEFGRKLSGYDKGRMTEFLAYYTGKPVAEGGAAPPPPIEDPNPTTPAPVPPVENEKIKLLEKQFNELQKKYDELAKRPSKGDKGDLGEKGPKGDVGGEGKPGKNGSDGKNGADGTTPEVDYEKIVADVEELLKAKIDACCCQCKKESTASPVSGKPEESKEDCCDRIGELEALVKGLLDAQHGPLVPAAPERRILYFTSRNLSRVKATDILARKLKADGKTITIITLDPHQISEDNVRDVPRVHVLPGGQNVVGVDDVTKFLSTWKE